MGYSITNCVLEADTGETTQNETESRKEEPDTASDHW